MLGTLDFELGRGCKGYICSMIAELSVTVLKTVGRKSAYGHTALLKGVAALLRTISVAVWQESLYQCRSHAENIPMS